MPTRNWLHEIHAENPYVDFPVGQFGQDLQGWGFESPIFEHIVEKYKPAKMIEVGSWKGASAVRLAELLKTIGKPPETQLICVDTWLGSDQHWLLRDAPDMFPAMKLKWGRPQLYEQFLANVILNRHTDIIVPFPASASAAAKFMLAKGMIADAIYLDADHSYDEVMADLTSYWKIVRPGGVVFGDDYILGWIGVVRAVHDFADRHGCRLDTSFHHKFILEKTA